jgi:outer membrane receptor protein involved in Fe transport
MTRSRKRKLQRLHALQSVRRVVSALPLAPLLLAGVPTVHAQDAILEEVVVTAQKQQENLQAVPMSIQAFGATKLEELRINNMADYMKFMPSVTFQTGGPGWTRVFMRGVASGDNGNHSGPMPSVGQYLDEQPITTIQGALDIHLYDIERVEMLAGPQGTLYGASSQSGTIRTITNKPDPKAFSASYDLQGSYVENGDAGYTAEGYVNIPLTDSSAVRLVGWYEHSPGYIDNVKGTMTYPTSGITVDNYGLAKDDYNDGDTYGARALLKIDLNDRWSVTPGIMAQVANYNGLFAYDQNIGDLELTHFFKEDSQDTWVQASLTVEGKIGSWDMVYAGAYLDRGVDGRLDYSDYAYWYDVCCGYGTSMVNDDGDFISPAQHIKSKDDYKTWSNELRFSSPQDKRLRFTGGLFAQSAEHRIEQRYMVDDMTTDYWVTGWPDTIWLTQQTRTDESYALFGELYFDITEKLTATAGYRLFDTNNDLKGFFGFSQNFSTKTGESQCFPEPGYFIPDPDNPGEEIYVPSDPALWNSYNGAPCVNLNKNTDESGGTPKLNLSYRFSDDHMVYLTYSEGFRPGGVNRRGTFPAYKADYLTNYEGGWKTTWAGGRVRFNGAIFFQEWDDFQYSFLGENGLTNIRNAGKAEINGLEAYVDWAATDQWLFTAGATWLDPVLAEDFCQAIDEDPCDPANFAKDGTQLPVTPTFKGNLIARYTFKVGEYDADVQGSYVYQNDAESELLPYNRQFTGTQGAFGIADFSASMRKGPYSLTFYINNAFDERAELYKYQECAVEVCGTAGNPGWEDTPAFPGYSIPHPYTTYTGTNQPRTYGLIFRQEF